MSGLLLAGFGLSFVVAMPVSLAGSGQQGVKRTCLAQAGDPV